MTELSQQQSQVINAFDSGQNIFVTGGAGSGKSFLLNYLKRHYTKSNLVVTASTGIAAVNIGGSTIHSWSGIGLGNLPAEKIVENIFSNKFINVRRKIIQARALAIDEISMVSSTTLDLIDVVLRAVRQSEKPMGGLQILFFGDFLQLPPISNVANDLEFCFNSKCWQELDLQIFNLEEKFRQTDQKFVKILNNLRFGNLDDEDISLLQSRTQIADDNLAIKPTILTTHNYKVDKINSYHLKNIPKDEVTYEAKYKGNQSKIELLKKNCIAPQFLKLKIGAQVMMTKNTYQKDGIINGSLGVVKGFSLKKKYPIVEFSNGAEITISPEEWLIESFDKNKGELVCEASVAQIPLILSWAITIHKSQGLTLDKISCDLSDIFSPGQAYVALSRARSLSGVFIEKINFNKITSAPSARQFYNKISAF